MERINKNGYVEVSAENGKFLTQKALEDESDRIFVLVVCTAHPEQWEEWTAEQKEAWEAEHIEEETS
ncbi:MAG: hypothetical protein J5529_03000 [Prevotella sp.]|nr:hypothetical protein [Prevotella sp.]